MRETVNALRGGQNNARSGHALRYSRFYDHEKGRCNRADSDVVVHFLILFLAVTLLWAPMHDKSIKYKISQAGTWREARAWGGRGVSQRLGAKNERLSAEVVYAVGSCGFVRGLGVMARRLFYSGWRFVFAWACFSVVPWLEGRPHGVGIGLASARSLNENLIDGSLV